MSFWVAALALALAVAGGLAWPLLRPAATIRRRDDVLSVYRDQLRELDREVERGLVVAEEAAAVRAEIERRVLAVGRDLARQPAASPTLAGRPIVATVVALLVIGGSVALYDYQGRPDLPGQPLAMRDVGAVQAEMQELNAELQQLEALALGDPPQDPGFWLVLGQLRSQLIGPDEAGRAYEEGLVLNPGEPRLLAASGEAMVQKFDGTVTAQARQRFELALVHNPGNVLAIYYLGMADAQAGDDEQALERWLGLLANAPADAMWRQPIVDAVRMAARRTGDDADVLLAALPAPAPSPPATAAGAEIAALPDAERNERIRSMVDGLAARLEAEPDDLEGWLQLGRSRSVLGEPDLAAEAFARARELSPDDADILKAEAAALAFAASDVDGNPVITTRAAELYSEAAKLAPGDPEPHWFLGLRALEQGDRAGAAKHWQDLLATLPADDPNRAAITAQIEALGPVD